MDDNVLFLLFLQKLLCEAEKAHTLKSGISSESKALHVREHIQGYGFGSEQLVPRE